MVDLLVETLQAAGVKTCYGIDSNTMNGIAHAIDRSQIDGSICVMKRPVADCPAGTLKVYEKFPHSMCTTHADVVNPDLLAFIAS